MSARPKVSVFVLTHDHVDWIGQALDSALEQEAPFPFEILVADDFSTDGTRELVLEYARRHPELIRTFLPEENLRVEGIWLKAARQCRGEYIALLDGDDYWTSERKIAQQAPLLDANPDWVSCFHRATLFHEDGKTPPRQVTPHFDADVFELEDVLEGCFIPYLTVMFRRGALAGIPDWGFSYLWYDWLFHIYCAHQGRIGFFDADLAAYRVHERGNWSARDRTTQIEEDLRVYDRLAGEFPSHRRLLERCVERRHCQLAVEAAALPLAPVIQIDPGGMERPYFNGRGAREIVPTAGNESVANAEMALGKAWREAAEETAQEFHYAPRLAPRGDLPETAFAVLVSRSAEEALGGDTGLSALLEGAGPALWEDSSCRIQAVDIDFSDLPRAGGAEDMGALVEITDVAISEGAELQGGFLDEPKGGAVLDAHVIDVLGWALGAEARAVAVEFAIDGEPFWRAPLRTERPDLTDAYPDTPEAASSGFRTTLNLIGTPAEFELEVAVVLKDQSRSRLATIAGRHRWRRDRSPAYADLVSVVIPCYGQSHFLSEAIESALAQTYPHLEIVVIDDESMDNASSIASRYPGVRCVREENSGMAGARNVGIRSTNGDFLVFLDADDTLLPDAIEAGLRQLQQHPECACAVGTYRRTSHDGKPLNTHEQPTVDQRQYAQLMRDNWAGFPARAIYRRALFEHVRGFDPDLDAAADFGFNLAVAREFPICSHGALVAEHREHGRNSSGDAAKMLKETLAAMRQQRPYAKRDRDLRRAYKDGVRHWKAYYGDLLSRQARESLRERRFGDALREMGLLARHRPRGLLVAVGLKSPPAD